MRRVIRAFPSARIGSLETVSESPWARSRGGNVYSLAPSLRSDPTGEHMNPSDERSWSGILMQFEAALRRVGHHVDSIGPLKPSVTLWGRMKGRFYRHVLGRIYAINPDPAVFRARSIH